MTSFTLLITSSPHSTAHHTALQFAQTLLDNSHQLLGVFFFHDAVAIANSLIRLPTDEPSLQQAWQNFRQDNQVPLYLCSTAALRRGILDNQSADEQDLSSVNCMKEFEIAGLGELMSLSQQADRTVQF